MLFSVYIPAENQCCTIQSDNGKQGYKVGGKNYCRPKVFPFPAALAADIAAIGFGEAKNPELVACCQTPAMTMTPLIVIKKAQMLHKFKLAIKKAHVVH